MSRLLSATLVVAAILLATIGWEVWDSPTSDLGSSSGGQAMPQTGRIPEATETSDLVRSWLATALERPLFSENRRPAKPPEDPARNANQAMRLTGVITGPFGSRAIFQSGESAKPVVVEEKAHWNGYVVQSIEPGKAVVVDSSGDARTLKPSFVERDQTPRRQR